MGVCVNIRNCDCGIFSLNFLNLLLMCMKRGRKALKTWASLAVSIDALQTQCMWSRHSVSESVALGSINLRVQLMAECGLMATDAGAAARPVVRRQQRVATCFGYLRECLLSFRQLVCNYVV